MDSERTVARLGQLKLAMATSIFFVAYIFATFLTIVMLIVQQFVVQVGWNYWVILIIVVPILFILFQYLIGPAIVQMSTRLKYLEKGENPWLESTVRELVERSGVPMPKVATVPNNTPNAFVFGRSASGATLAVHDGLLKSLSQEEIEGVIAHELGHIKHKDFIVMTVLSALPLIAYLVAQMAFRAGAASSYSRGRDKQGNGGIVLIAVGFVSFIVYIITFLAVMRLSRLREHYADAYSAYATGEPRQLGSALTKITYGLSLSPKPPHGARTLYIGDPALAKQEVQGIMQRRREYDLDKDGVLDERELELAMEREAKSRWTTVNTWFATHPATYQRILLLREMEKEMETGRYSSDRVYVHI